MRFSWCVSLLSSEREDEFFLSSKRLASSTKKLSFDINHDEANLRIEVFPRIKKKIVVSLCKLDHSKARDIVEGQNMIIRGGKAYKSRVEVGKMWLEKACGYGHSQFTEKFIIVDKLRDWIWRRSSQDVSNYNLMRKLDFLRISEKDRVDFKYLIPSA